MVDAGAKARLGTRSLQGRKQGYEPMHARISLVVLIIFVKTLEFISRDMIHAYVARYNDTN